MFPGDSDGKESACNGGDPDSIPGLGRPPGGGHGNPLQYSCPENAHGQRSLEGHSPWGRRVGHDWATGPESLWREKHCSCERGDLPGGAASGKVLLGVWGGRAPGPFPCPVSAAPEKGPRGALRFDVCNWKGGHPSPSGPGAWQPQPRGWPLPWTWAWDQEGSSLAHGRQEPRRSGLDCSPLWASRLLDLLTAAAFRAGPPGSPGLCQRWADAGGVEARPSCLRLGQLWAAGLAPETTPGCTFAAAPRPRVPLYRGPRASSGRVSWEAGLCQAIPRWQATLPLLPEGTGLSSKGLLETPRSPGCDHRALPACSVGRPDGASSLPPRGTERPSPPSQPGGPWALGRQPDPGITDPWQQAWRTLPDSRETEVWAPPDY